MLARFRAAAAAALLAAAFASTAAAAVMVLGKGPGNACYEAANAERADRGSFADCAAALEDDSLTLRDRAATYVNRSVLWLVRGQPSKALADVDAADRLLPGLVPADINRGAAFIMLERYGEARTALDRAVAAAQGLERLPALVNRAMARESLGDLKGALSDLNAALAIDPAYEPATVEIARYSRRSS